jgi:hypothetical protein
LTILGHGPSISIHQRFIDIPKEAVMPFGFPIAALFARDAVARKVRGTGRK